MDILKIILPLLISGIIGYGTNYIAVKMLFRPRRAIKVFGRTLPFTPGIIPKNQHRLAKALGETVGTSLFTSDDLKSSLLDEKNSKTISEEIIKELYSDISIKSRIEKLSANNNYEFHRNNLNKYITEKIMVKLNSVNIGDIIIKESSSAIKEKTANSMLAMFINDDLINSLALPVSNKINEYIDLNGYDYVYDAVNEELEKLEMSTISSLLSKGNVKQETIEKAIIDIYSYLISKYLDNMLSNLNIPAIVEQKVNEMDVIEVENLVMSVMKHELNAVINLGALIGIIIGFLNVFVQQL